LQRQQQQVRQWEQAVVVEVALAVVQAEVQGQVVA